MKLFTSIVEYSISCITELQSFSRSEGSKRYVQSCTYTESNRFQGSRSISVKIHFHYVRVDLKAAFCRRTCLRSLRFHDLHNYGRSVNYYYSSRSNRCEKVGSLSFLNHFRFSSSSRSKSERFIIRFHCVWIVLKNTILWVVPFTFTILE